MDLKDAIYGRRAVREYTSEPVSRDLLDRLIDAAIQAPSAVNQQSWSFVVVREQALLDRISRESKAYMLANLPAASPDHFREMLGNPEFQIFYHAPAMILISATAKGEWNVEDCSLAAENLMLTAFAAGLGSCWIGFAQKWLGTPAGREALALPASHVPVAPIIVGHPKSSAPPVPRKAPAIYWID